MLALVLGMTFGFAASPKKAAKKQKQQRVGLLAKSAAQGNVAELEILLQKKKADGSKYFSQRNYDGAMLMAAKACQLATLQVFFEPKYEITFKDVVLQQAEANASNTRWSKQYYNESFGEGVVRKTHDKTPQQLAAEQKPCDEVISFLEAKQVEKTVGKKLKKDKEK